MKSKLIALTLLVSFLSACSTMETKNACAKNEKECEQRAPAASKRFFEGRNR